MSRMSGYGIWRVNWIDLRAATTSQRVSPTRKRCERGYLPAALKVWPTALFTLCSSGEGRAIVIGPTGRVRVAAEVKEC